MTVSVAVSGEMKWAFSIGWSEAPEQFKHGIAAAFLDVEPPEVDQEAYKRALDLFSRYWERVKRFG
jgi:hypothetical protein